MTDLEGTTRTLINKKWNKEEIISKLVDEYLVYKEISEEQAIQLASAVHEECIRSEYAGEDPLVKDILNIPKANIAVGEQGVGCRGVGDFFVHKILADLSSTSTEAYLSPKSLDDAGAVKYEDFLIISKMEGMHSRLSDFPFIAAPEYIYDGTFEPRPWEETIHGLKRNYLSKVLEHTGGVKKKAAELLQIQQSYLALGLDIMLWLARVRW